MYRCVQFGSRLGLTSVTSVTCSVTIQVIGSKWSRGEGRVSGVQRTAPSRHHSTAGRL